MHVDLPAVKPCPICAACDRNAGGKCRPCQKRRSDAWAAANADKERARKAAIYQANRETVIARSAAWYAANKERASVTGAARYARNPDLKCQQAADWLSANRERARATGLAWQRKNRGKVYAASAKWRAANPEKHRQMQAAWRAKNPSKMRSIYANRRARLRAGGRMSADIVSRLFKLQRGRCACCGNHLGQRYELDHVMPLALGGSNTDDNAQLLRSICNRRKSARHPVDYMQSRGLLL